MRQLGVTYLSVLFFLFFTLLSSCLSEHQEKDSFPKIEVPKKIKSIYLTLDRSKFDSIYTKWNENTYIPVSIEYKGKKWKKTKLRLRGDTSREYPKKSLKLVFDKSELFIDSTLKLNLNAEFKDKSFCRQWISSQLMKSSGQTCFNATPIKVYVNNEYFGIYLQVENIDKNFMVKNNLDPKSNLYKATRDGACLSTLDDIPSKWEKKSNKKGSWSDLQQLIHDINHTPDDKFHTFLKHTFEYDKLVNIIALNMYLSNASTYYHNYYAFHDLHNTGKWELLPWDMDKSLSYYNFAPYTYHHTSNIGESDNMLVERALDCPPFFDDLKERLKVLSKTTFTPEHLNPVLDQLSSLLKDAVLQDSSHGISSKEDFNGRIKNEKKYFKNHYKKLIDQIHDMPTTFKVNRFEKTQHKDVTFKWNHSKSNRNKELSYTLHIGENILYEKDKTEIIKEIKTNYYTFNNMPEGNYFWYVEATDGEFTTIGYNSKNLLKVKHYTELNSNINTPTKLTIEKSPYLISQDILITASLEVEPGVAFYFNNNSTFQVNYASIQLNGTKSAPITFAPMDGVKEWNQFYLLGCNEHSTINNVIFKEGRFVANGSNFTISNSKFLIDSKQLTISEEERPPILWAQGGNIIYNNNVMSSNGQGEGINIHKATVQIKNSEFINTPDAIELINVYNSTIENNYVADSPDDAIDLNGCTNINIKNNTLFNNYDKGISIGTEQYGHCKNISINNNLIINCRTGISVKDSSIAYGNNNILINNELSLRSYKKRDGYKQGGNLELKNTFILTNSENILSKDNLSNLTLENTTCNKQVQNGSSELINISMQKNKHLSAYVSFIHNNYQKSFPFLPTLSLSTNKNNEIIINNNFPIDIDLSIFQIKSDSTTKTITLPYGTRVLANQHLTISKSKKTKNRLEESLFLVKKIPFDSTYPIHLFDKNRNQIASWTNEN